MSTVDTTMPNRGNICSADTLVSDGIVCGKAQGTYVSKLDNKQ